jgi:hypothetical protein
MQYVCIVFKSDRNPIMGVLRYAITPDTRTVSVEWAEKDMSHLSQINRAAIKHIHYL